MVAANVSMRKNQTQPASAHSASPREIEQKKPHAEVRRSRRDCGGSWLGHLQLNDFQAEPGR